MKISYHWLQDYLPTTLSPQQAAEILTDIGLEVEGIDEVESVKGGLKGVVIGEVLSCEQHPNADKLKLTTVNIGAAKPVQIVCGAPNVAQGQKVPVATVGCTLYPNDEPLKIKKSKLRGEVSEGMICAEDELGLGSSHEGIMVLESKVAPGTKAADYFEVKSDFIFEIGLTPNRSDAMCHLGVARDLKAALAIREVENKTLNWPGVSTFNISSSDLPVKVTIENEKACHRYAGLSLRGVQVAPSPTWLQERLRAIGLAPINNVVDITNFVLHETGHPLHAFDLDKIAEHHIIVKNLPEGTPFTTLDGKERTLSADDLMICDAQKPLVLAGIFGGLHSGVTETTTSIFLESAIFDPVAVRKSAKRHSLSTDASFRYERGIDPEITIYALKRAAILIRDIAGGVISMNIRDTYPVKPKPAKVKLNLERAERLIGKKLPTATIKNILLELEIRITAESGQDLFLEVPPYRHDVTREADIIEEILRLYGFNQIETDGRMQISIAQNEPRSAAVYREMIANMLSNRGYYEIMNNSLTQKSYYENYGFNPEQCVPIVNPLSKELGVMRQSLLFGGLEAIRHNLRRQRTRLRFYEFGQEYRLLPKGYHEKDVLGLWISGAEHPENWRSNSGNADFYSLKSEITALLQRLGIAQWQEKEARDKLWSEALSLHIHNKPLVTLGQVQPALLQQMEIKQPVYYARIDWEGLSVAAAKTNPQYKPVPRYPAVRRDLALLLDKEVPYHQLRETALKAERNLLKEVNLFDVYEGENLPEGKKSYALSFTLQDDADTLQDARVDKVMEKILKAYQHKFSAQLR